MTPRSLRFRLLSAAGVSVLGALLVAGVGLTVIFELHAGRRLGAELETYLKQIVAGIDIQADGRISATAALADPRFEQPLSGLYWQVQDTAHQRLLRSRSLWDAVIALPGDELAPGAVHAHELPGPAGQTLLTRERSITLRHAGAERAIRIAVAMDRRNLVEARNAFAADMLPYLAVMAALLLAAAWLQVRIGLAPLDGVRRGVMDIRAGTSHRIAPGHPDEVMPLVDEINALLAAQEQTIERARAWTADLAHGLKTPLTVLTADAQRLREAGNSAIADDLDQLADTMRRRVDRELIRARVRTGLQDRRARAAPAETVARIVRTLQRTPRGARLDWSVEVPETLTALILPDDLAELLGNILDNAVNWARTGITVIAGGDGDTVSLRIEDDGPGVPEEQQVNLGRRGVRLDEQQRGNGLGLAIARDIAEAYRGDLTFGRAEPGGLAVNVHLPAAHPLPERED